ncbi:MAG: iron uptake system EfeUOB component EfeO/EfeM [Nonlabens sp.]
MYRRGRSFHQTLAENQVILSDKGRLDHHKWDLLLKKYVDSDGFVDYQGFKEQEEELKEYLDYLK